MVQLERTLWHFLGDFFEKLLKVALCGEIYTYKDQPHEEKYHDQSINRKKAAFE